MGPGSVFPANHTRCPGRIKSFWELLLEGNVRDTELFPIWHLGVKKGIGR
jgi:hypothetical protein